MPENMLTRDQRRAVLAYEAVALDRNGDLGGLDDGRFKDYKILVNDLGASILRSGLSATLSFIERDKSAVAREYLLRVLAMAELPHLTGIQGRELPARVRTLPVAEYMLVTREVLQLSIWLRRAVQSRDTVKSHGSVKPQVGGGGDAREH